jgi:hypothetical protein
LGSTSDIDTNGPEVIGTGGKFGEGVERNGTHRDMPEIGSTDAVDNIVSDVEQRHLCVAF